MKEKILRLLIVLITLGGLVQAQVSIGRTVKNPSAILDFKSGIGGIVLPKIEAAAIAAISEPGTIIYNCPGKNIVYYNGTALQPLSNQSTVDPVECKTNRALLKEVGEGVLVGSPTSKKGTLVLNNSTKALLLPKVDNAYKMGSPAAGTIVYDPKNKVISIYNGSNWGFLSN